MGSMDKLGQFAGEVVKSQIEDVKKRTERIQRYKEMYDKYDDKRLYQEYKRSSDERKVACALLLKERGYGK